MRAVILLDLLNKDFLKHTKAKRTHCLKEGRRKWQPTPLFLPKNPVDRGAWWAAVHRVALRRT